MNFNKEWRAFQANANGSATMNGYYNGQKSDSPLAILTMEEHRQNGNDSVWHILTEGFDNSSKQPEWQTIKEYKEYISVFGVAVFEGHELTGICNGRRLDVVRVTSEEKKYNSFVPDEWYVLESLDIDGAIIWQNGKGEVYQTIPNGKIIKVHDSLYEYIDDRN